MPSASWSRPASTFKQRSKRYGWLRLYEDFITHPKWKLVARMTGQEPCVVRDVVIALLIAASKAHQRGYIGGLNFHECAVQSDLKPDIFISTYRALMELGWIEDGFIVDWMDRQPDFEDPTAAERQRNKRARDRAQQRVQLGVGDDDDVAIMSRVTGVMPAAAKREPERPAPHTVALEWAQLASDTPAARAEAAAANAQIARLWLVGDGTIADYGSGSMVVAQRLGMTRLSADLCVRRWLKELDGDVRALAEIIDAADREALQGAAFENVVKQKMAQVVAEQQRGPKLPLGLGSVRGGAA